MGDDDWIYPAEMYLLPQNAKSFGERMSAERKKYIRADLADAAYLAGVKAGLEAAARAARGDGESEFFNPVQAIRALDPAAIARAAQKEGE